MTSCFKAEMWKQCWDSSVRGSEVTHCWRPTSKDKKRKWRKWWWEDRCCSQLQTSCWRENPSFKTCSCVNLQHVLQLRCFTIDFTISHRGRDEPGRWGRTFLQAKISVQLRQTIWWTKAKHKGKVKRFQQSTLGLRSKNLFYWTDWFILWSLKTTWSQHML